MGLIDLFNKNIGKVGVFNPDTYEDKVFQMEKSGINDLVEMDIKDPTFRPPLQQVTYLEDLNEMGNLAAKY